MTRFISRWVLMLVCCLLAACTVDSAPGTAAESAGAATAPGAILTSELLATVFGVCANIVVDPASGAPVCLPFALAVD